MELKINLSVGVDFSYDNELSAINKWNQKSNPIYYVAGYLEATSGSLDIVTEDFSLKHTYAFSLNPTVKPTISFDIDGNTVACDDKELDKFICNAGSVVIGVIEYATLCLSKKEDFSWIKVKRFDETKYDTIEEKYQALQKHHQEEVSFLIDYIKQNCKK